MEWDFCNKIFRTNLNLKKKIHIQKKRLTIKLPEYIQISDNSEEIKEKNLKTIEELLHIKKTIC